MGETPQYDNELFQQRPQNENEPQLRPTFGLTFVPPRPNKEIFKQSIAYSGPIIWKSLRATSRSVDNINKFHLNFIKWT